MHTPFENEISRVHLQNLIDKKPDIAREYSITDLLHKIDPSATLDPVAEDLILDAADDFIDSIVNLATECAKNRGSSVLQADDIRYVIRRKFGDSSISGKYDIQRQPDFIPNEVHLKRLKALQEHLKATQQSNHTDQKHPQ
ncbi:hypothetical protein M9Y10_039560 [Tritrichomonas musculus]|uniref:Transcription initiation factor TFIID subunit 12 domain-containing protein n=1 Tax=Tritrichomonas musculus TaxID=1915356 RepID=A0ABR2KC86_9EUKA